MEHFEVHNDRSIGHYFVLNLINSAGNHIVVTAVMLVRTVARGITVAATLGASRSLALVMGISSVGSATLNFGLVSFNDLNNSSAYFVRIYISAGDDTFVNVEV